MRLSAPSFTVELDDEEMGSFFPTSKLGPFLDFLTLRVLMGEKSYFNPSFMAPLTKKRLERPLNIIREEGPRLKTLG